MAVRLVACLEFPPLQEPVLSLLKEEGRVGMGWTTCKWPTPLLTPIPIPALYAFTFR